MSRSIHATRVDFRRELRFNFTDPKAKRAHLKRLATGIARKRDIKAFTREVRETPRWIDLPPAAPDTIPIEVVERKPCIYYAASPSDLLAVMKRLPAGVLSGLTGIHLRAGKQYTDENLTAEERATAIRDPWLGRLGLEELPGVFVGEVLGTYWNPQARIDLYAPVHDPAATIPAAWQVYFRLQMLSTFVHEVAHHQDRMHRLANGRWRGDDRATEELYANRQQSQWVRQCVVPYLEEAYSAAVEELLAWVRDHGGVALPLTMLASDCWWPADGKLTLVSFGSARDAFTRLVRETSAGICSMAARLSFARGLCANMNYTEALVVAQTIVAAEPENTDALAIISKIRSRRGS